MLKSVLDLLRPGGRFVLTNICPQEMDDWLIYRYFPAARALDLHDFWTPGAIESVMREEGFQAVQVELGHFHHEQDMRVFLDRVHRRDICSQLIAISDEAYTAGVAQLGQELLMAPESYMQPDHACVLTIRGDRLAEKTLFA